MHILEGFLQGITADSKVRDAELKSLMGWLSAHQEFADRHPFNEVISRVQRIIAHGIVDEEERADLLWISNKLRTADEYYGPCHFRNAAIARNARWNTVGW